MVLIKSINNGTSLVVQWVILRAPNAGGLGSIPGLGTTSLMPAATKDLAYCNQESTCCNQKIPHAATKTRCSQNKQTNK